MEPSGGAEPTRIATSDELRQAALARAAMRGAQVSRRRIAKRWVAWLLSRLALFVVLPAALIAAGWWWLHAGGGRAGPLHPEAAAVPATAPARAQSPSSSNPQEGASERLR